MKKSVLFAVFVMCMALILFPSAVLLAENAVSGFCGEKVTWTLDDEGTLTINGVGEMDDFYQAQGGQYMPSWYDDYRENIKTVEIEDSVSSIGMIAFRFCTNLRDVSISDSVTEIGMGAFEHCSSLRNVNIPDGVTSINGVFACCDGLREIRIPDSVTDIDGAFLQCSSLRNVNIPDGVTSVGSYTFSFCSSLRSVRIPRGVTSISHHVFNGCDNLTDIYYDGDEDDWESIDIKSGNDPLWDAEIHYNSKWNPYLFQSPSTEYNNSLALVAAEMSEKAEQCEKTEEGEAAIRDLYNSYGLTDCEYFNFGKNWVGFNESAAFAIGQDSIIIDGVDTTALVITVRGSQTNWEFLGDLFKGGRKDFLGTRVWHNVYEFYKTIWDGVRDYIYRHPDLSSKEHMKVLINGHSLGGAAANMLGAMLTNGNGMNDGIQWLHVEKEDIYVYTFGTIKVLTEENEDRNISDGYENIHNIYNYYDSFGPHGNWKDQNASAIKAKFGHTELYYLDEGETGWLMWNRTSNNHNMSNYKKALEQNKVSCFEVERKKIINRIEKLKMLEPITQKNMETVQIAVFCSVDVEIYASDGSLAGSVIDNEIEEMESGKVYICVEGDRKYIYLLDDDRYTVKLKGTDVGTMTYSVKNIHMDTGEVMEEKTFTDVVLKFGKQFAGFVAVEDNIASGIADDEIKLFVVKEDGKPEKEALADGNGTEAAIKEEPGKPENPDEGKPGDKNPGENGADGKKPSVKVKSIKISGISKKIAAGKKITLKAAVSPSNAADKSITWKSSNPKYATVNSKGIVATKKAGVGKTVTVTASAKDGSGKKASYKIKIMKGMVKKVAIAGKAPWTAKAGTVLKLKASVKASGKANKTLQWESGNPKYAVVDGKGRVTLKKAGKRKTVRITAMATDGSGKKASVKIKIK